MLSFILQLCFSIYIIECIVFGNLCSLIKDFALTKKKNKFKAQGNNIAGLHNTCFVSCFKTLPELSR